MWEEELPWAVAKCSPSYSSTVQTLHLVQWTLHVCLQTQNSVENTTQQTPLQLIMTHWIYLLIKHNMLLRRCLATVAAVLRHQLPPCFKDVLQQWPLFFVIDCCLPSDGSHWPAVGTAEYQKKKKKIPTKVHTHTHTHTHTYIGMRAAYSFKHPLFSDNVEFCGWVCLFVCLSARFFKMLLLRHFLSDWADILTRWSPTWGK